MFTNTPGIDRLSGLPRPVRLAHLADVDLVVGAVATAYAARDRAFRRVNIEILGGR